MKILIVEDEEKIAKAIRRGLEQEHYVVDLAFDGTIGQDLAAEAVYDVIILDRMLPGIDGMTLCKQLRQKGDHTPILMLTAKGQVNYRVEGLKGGADDYLTKPFAFEELLARLQALTRRPHKTESSFLEVGDLSIDPETYIVTRGKKQLLLSAKEFALLSFLVQHKNTIVTKEQIIRHVWNYDADILTNTVEVYMGYLRNKIDKPFAKKLIHTVRGFGYKMGE